MEEFNPAKDLGFDDPKTIFPTPSRKRENLNKFSVVRFNDIPELQKYVGKVLTVENTIEILEASDAATPDGFGFFTIIQIGVNHFVAYKRQKIILKRRWC